MRQINHIVIHHSASSLKTTAEDIAGWHIEKGWTGPGYHFCIESDGKLIMTRTIDRVGAHVLGHNDHTLGVCLVGDNTTARDRWVAPQIETLKRTLSVLGVIFPESKVLGHRDLPDTATECPGLDIRELLGLEPL